MNELTINKEKVLEAAKTCPDAAKVLKTLFPEVFKDEGGDVTILGYARIHSNKEECLLENRGIGRYKNKGFYLMPSFNWAIVKDAGAEVLVPTRK